MDPIILHHHSHLDFLMICTMLCWTDPTSECLCVKPPLVTDKQREEEEKAIGRRLMKEVSEVWLVKLRHSWVVFIDICRAPVMVQQAKEMQLKSGPGFLFGGFSHIFPSGLTRPTISCSNLQREEGGWGGISLERVRGSCDFCDVALACEDESLCKNTTCLCLLFSLRDVEMSLYSSGHGAADKRNAPQICIWIYASFTFCPPDRQHLP